MEVKRSISYSSQDPSEGWDKANTHHLRRVGGGNRLGGEGAIVAGEGVKEDRTARRDAWTVVDDIGGDDGLL